jgi:hypothetical protein
MKQCLIFCVFMFLISACASEDKKVPGHIMPVDTIKVIVWELIYAGAYASIIKEKDTTATRINTTYFYQVLQLHHISKKVFFESFDFYQTHPVLNKQLFDSVSAYSQRQRTVLYEKKFSKKK